MFKLRRLTRLHCSFCRKSDKEVEKLIGGPGVYICDACVGICNNILDGKSASSFPEIQTLGDAEIIAALSHSEAKIEQGRKLLQMQVDILRSRGVSWAVIGDALGISRQAAWERFS
jgi:hypothetical protein